MSTSSSTSSAGAGGASPTYATSCLGGCISSACKSQISACNGDPTCASYLACLDGCPVTSSGDVDPACVAQCPPVSGLAGTDAKDAFDACRQQAAGASCAKCVGGMDGGGTGGAGGAAACQPPAALMQQCPASTGTDACGKCQYERCCDSVNQVFNGGPATDFANCVQACTDLACVQACATKYPNGVQGFGEYEGCAYVECSATGACATDQCGACSYKNCGCELASCESDPGCFLILECESYCTTTTCAKACVTNATGAASAQLAETYAVCVSQRCITACGG